MNRYTLTSWNVNGLRAILKKGNFQDYLNQFQPDIICLQETKAKQDQVVIDLPEYQEIWNSASRPGYSGTAIFTKVAPLNVFYGFPDSIAAKHAWSDAYGSPLDEGRVLTIELPEFYLVTVYTPNSKNDLSRLQLRHQLWDVTFLEYLKHLRQTKPVVTCGDFNAAHTDMDLARPKQNTHNAGFTAEERQGITNLLSAGFIDTFRTLHPDEQRYTWWSHWGHARENNVGWRIDYFFISNELATNLEHADIHEQVLGSDHCPVSITLNFNHS